jgi:hypothetical protein
MGFAFRKRATTLYLRKATAGAAVSILQVGLTSCSKWSSSSTCKSAQGRQIARMGL